MKVDFGKAAADYGRYRAGMPDLFYERVFAMNKIAAGQRVLDVGTGTGTVARALAMRGCQAFGLDPSRSLLDEARRLDREVGATVFYVEGRAENTGLASANFDAITAVQCWHWFDRPRAAAELRRLLRPDGCLIIAHFDWLPLPGNVVEATEQLIRKHNPRWALGGSTGIHPQWLTDVAAAGFVRIETFSFDLAVPYSHVGWRGRIRASAGVAASLAPDAVAAFDAELAADLAQRFSADPLAIPHRVWAVTSQSPAQGNSGGLA